MKVDTSRLKKGPSEVPPECQQLIDRLRSCNPEDLAVELAKIETWTFGKCELCHWIEILDYFDDILMDATKEESEYGQHMSCDVNFTEEQIRLLLLVLNFTTLLIEHSFSRHLYNSIEHLTALLQSINLDIVLGVLNLLYMFSKRSNFLSRLGCNKKTAVSNRLKYIAENWGGKDAGFGLADCCCDNIVIPASVSSFYYEYYKSDGSLETVTLDDNDLAEHDIRYLTELVCSKLKEVTDDQKYHIFCRVRLSKTFKDYKARLLLVQARLQALSVLIYSDALTGYIHQLIYPGFLEELVELLELQKPNLVDIRAAALRTLTSIIHLDRNAQYMRKNEARLNVIIDVTGASSYHGFLPSMVRSCINNLILSTSDPTTDTSMFPLQLATALFSFLYHLASYEGGAEALVSCGMMEGLLKVINWSGSELEHITFVTRAVRVIDLITNIDMGSFQSHDGLNNFIDRLSIEVNLCRQEQPYEIQPRIEARAPSPSTPNEQDEGASGEMNAEENEIWEGESEESEDVHMVENTIPAKSTSNEPRSCLPQRAALLKSMLNFLKKAIQDTAFADSIRRVMDGSLPKSLKHIISNSEYYGPSLFLLATDVVTVYVFQEPSFLSSLQDNGLTDVILQALLKKDVPATREVLGSLPNVFSALCLNRRGLASFVKYNPFDKLFKVLLSPVYLSAMRRRRSSDPIGDTASNLGNAMDELMRNQPSLKTDATKAIIRLLKELVQLGTDPKYVCWRAQSKNDTTPTTSSTSRQSTNTPREDMAAGSSDDEDDDEEEASTSSHNPHREENQEGTANTGAQESSSSSIERIPIALIDYILNVMKFVDAILSNNSTDDHCREFVEQGGLEPLLQILALPNLPVTSCNTPITATAQAVAAVCKSILSLAHEPQVLQVALTQLASVVDNLKPLRHQLDSPNDSILLRELANCQNTAQAFSCSSATPILHAMNAVHGYVVMLVHVCRTGQQDIRTMSLNKWSHDKFGKKLLQNLVQLYTALVWESTLLLALCTDDISAGCNFGKEDIDKMLPNDLKAITEVNWNEVVVNLSAMEGKPDETGSSFVVTMDVDNNESNCSSKVQKKTTPSPSQLKYIKSLLLASSRLGRALAELFGLLVKLSVGTTTRQRRGQNFPATPQFTSPASKEIARVLSYILVDGLSYHKLPPSPIPKLKLIFLICSVGFTSPMLFDEKRFAYHLMLQKFVEEGGLEVFFEMFKWALTAGGTLDIERAIESPKLPDGTGEFLDSWLILLEKMVNPRAILESPHVISATTKTKIKPEFDPIQYLINVHKAAYFSVMHIWGCAPLKTYGLRMSESILTILKHIFRGEKLIAEKYVEKKDPKEGSSGEGGEKKDQAEAGASTSGATAATDEIDPRVNQAHLQRLLDMGFSQSQSVEALLETGNVEQAADRILSGLHSSTLNDSAANAAVEIASSIPTNMDVDVTEEVIRAILLSIGDPNSTGAENRKEPKPGTSATSTTTVVQPEKEAYKKYLAETPLAKKHFDDFSSDALKTCLTLLDLLPEGVYRVCDLLVMISKRNGDTWRDDMLNNLVDEISDCLDFLIQVLNDDPSAAMSSPESCVSGPMSSKTAVRIHLFTLLFEGQYQELKIPCASAMVRKNILPKLVQVIVDIEKILKLGDKKTTITPKWLAPLFLLVDLYEKVAVYTQRKTEMHKVTTKVWKWYDLSTAKWNTYSAANNKIINDAYWANESSVRITFGRQRYTINFSCMTQVNDETGNHRPVILALKCMEKDAANPATVSTPVSTSNTEEGASGAAVTTESVPAAKPKTLEDLTDDVMDASPLSDLEAKFPGVVLRGLEQFNTQELVGACVRLMSHEFDKDTLHAIMRVCLRLTRTYENAQIFARENGVRLLLQMKQNCGYAGFTTLATLLIRHVIEEPKTLQLAMENVIYSRTAANLPTGCKELLYMTRQMSSAISRNSTLFKEVSQQILRIDVELLKRNQLNEDNRYLLKSLHPPNNRNYVLDDPLAAQAVKDLLAALVQPDVPTSNANSTPKPTANNNKNFGNDSREQNNTRSTESRFSERFDRAFPSSSSSSTTTAATTAAASTSSTSKEVPKSSDKTLVSKADILKILGDSVRSYQTVSLLITQYTYKAGCVQGMTEDTSALSYILDKLLYVNEGGSTDRECGNQAQFLIAGLAATSDVVSVQYAVVTEVKSALLRAFMMPESMEKHLQIEMIAGLIPVMIDSYVTADNHVLPKSQQSQSARYNIFFIMLRKGLISDLAKAAQYLDLSGPHTVATINFILKPLELLLRMSNEPVATSVFNKKKPLTASVAATTSVAGTSDARPTTSNAAASNAASVTTQGEEPSTSTANPISESTVAQDETMTDDSENTDYDISTVPESGIETTSEAQIQVHLSEILNSFLREDINNENEANQMANEERNSGEQGNDYPNILNETLDSSSESGDDTVSNASENEGLEIEEEEDEASENEDEADEHSELDVDEETRQFIEMYDQNVYSHHIRSPNIPELERDLNEDILMIQYSGNNSGSAVANSGPVPISTNQNEAENNPAPAALPSASSQPETTHRFTFSQIVEEQRRRRLEQSSNAENSADPLAVNDDGAAAPSHPLLVRRHSTSQSQDGGSTRNESRGTRSGRARRFNYLSMNGRPTDPPYRPPIILQRLLGPSNTSGNGTVTIRSDSARVVLMDNALSFITNNADDENADNDQVGYMYNRSLQSSNSTSTALTWWFEESKILGFESQSDVCLTVCDELVPDLERHKAQDLAKTRGKRKKKTDETEERPTKATTVTVHSNPPSEAPQATSTPPSASTEFAQALNLMDTSEPQPGGQPATDNQNITTASDQLQEMQINPDAERLTAAEQNQANTAVENPTQGDAEMADAVQDAQEQEAETRSEESDDSAEENVASQRMIMYYNSDDDDDSDDDNDDYEDGAVAESGTESGQGESENAVPAAEQASNMEVSPQPPSEALATEAQAEPAGTVGDTTQAQQVEEPAASASAEPSAEPSAPVTIQDVDPAIRSILGDLEIPEGIDPSFLAALPSEMRDEVIAEHLRQQRIRTRAAQPPPAPEVQPVAEVNPEFLAALPPNIQEEVLAQQRLEQQRMAAVNVNPNDPVDAAAFFQNLNPQLRQAILTDMEESQMSVLPPDLAQEAQNLRRDWETRNRQMMQMRLINQIGRDLDPRQYLPRTSFIQLNSSGITITRPGTSGMQIGAVMERQGGPLIDHEALSSILVLLFIDDPNISTLRLYRVIKNLCFHVPTRKWIIRALLSIIEKCSDELAAGPKMIDVSEASKLEWLNIRLDGALSCRTNVFVMKRPAGSTSGAIRKYETPITVHPKASPIVCRHTIDLLIFLAKSFPVHFLPLKRLDPNEPSTSNEAGTSSATAAPTAITTLATASTAVAAAKSKPKTNTLSSSSSSSGIASLKKDEPSTSSASLPEKPVEFWEILGTLDAKINQHRKLSVKASSRPVKEFTEPEISAFEISPFAQLIKILAHDTVKNSSQLTDKVLRLLSLVGVALPDNKPKTGTTTGSSNAAAAAANIRKPPQNYQVKQLFDDQNQTEAEQHLRVIVQVLTSKACSEDGLEDATTLLLNLSMCSNKTRYVIHHLLLHGACSVSQMVLKHIHDLMHELKQLKEKHVAVPVVSTNNISTNEKPENVVPVDDEELASSSNSSAVNASTSAASNSENTVRRTNRGMLQDRFTKESVIITAPNKVKTSCDLQLPSMVPLVSKTSSQAFFLRILKVITQIRDSVYQTMKAEIKSTTKTIEPNELELSPLSETLKLDELWDTLSECLKELEDTSDHHAVLVLQPTVEAFFLVHASSQSKNCAQLKASEEAQKEEDATAAQTENENSTSPNEETAEVASEPNPTVEDVNAMESTPSEPSTSTPAPSLDASGEPSVSKLPEIPTAAVTPAPAPLDPDQKKFLQFAETHRVVLNQILRQSTTHLADGPFAVMVDHTRILDFDIKRRYFRTELERIDEGIRREELAIHVHRVTVFEDSFRELCRRAPEDWKNRFYIVFEDEEGQDAGGLLREWYVIISREIFNPMYALFCVSPGDRVTYMINPSSHANPNHLCYYKFVGRVIAKAIYDNKLLECYFTRSFYKHILGIQVKYTDMESEDYDFYKGLVFLIEHQVSELGYDLTFSLEVQEFGVTEVRDLIPNGRNIVVTEETKLEYVHLVCQLKMSGSIRQQLNSFLDGFYDIIPKRLISIFNEQELELLISGLPNIDIEDLKANTEYHKYQANSIQVQWFWRALRSFDQADRAKFLQFVTGTSKVPLQGFASLEGMNGTQKFQIHRDDRSTNRLPSAHTCFNQLDLPVYKTYDKLRSSLLKAIHECSEGFGFA